MIHESLQHQFELIAQEVYKIALNNKYVLIARLTSTHKQQSCSPEWMLNKLSQANICSRFLNLRFEISGI